MTRLRVLPEAEAELEAATKQIEAERTGLGSTFIREVRAALERIRSLPHASRIERGETRVYSLTRFPYRIHYVVRSDEILVVAIGHRRRRPAYWRNRVEEVAVAYAAVAEAA